ncbi:hypothetical protein DFH07DRAFT_854238, partial [Mycena maculata]
MFTLAALHPHASPSSAPAGPASGGLPGSLSAPNRWIWSLLAAALYPRATLPTPQKYILPPSRACCMPPSPTVDVAASWLYRRRVRCSWPRFGAFFNALPPLACGGIPAACFSRHSLRSAFGGPPYPSMYFILRPPRASLLPGPPRYRRGFPHQPVFLSTTGFVCTPLPVSIHT